jgi:hypothetical protein
MEVVPACPLPTGSIVWQTWSGAFVLTVVCKATFVLRSIESPLADVQDPVFDADRYWNDNPREGLSAATDLVPFKRRADVILVGHAYAPYGEPVRSLLARLCVAGADKTIEVFSDRVFSYEGHLREGARFVKSKLSWPNAAGGPGTSNPVGIPNDAPRDTYGQRLLPRLQPPGLHVARADDAVPTIGFGPIAPTWPDRTGKLYAHASTWDHRGWHKRPLPRDIDAAYFNAAPVDQQVDAIRPDERIVLENLHPMHTRLATNLAAATPEAVVERAGRPVEAVPFLCDTMWIDTDRGVCSLSWRARIILDAPDAPGRVYVTLPQVGGAPAPIYSGAASPSAVAGTASPPVPVGVPAQPSSPTAGPAAPPPPAAPVVPALPADPFPIERCAAMAASIALRAGDRAKILADNDVSEDEWDEIEHRWSQVLRKDAEQDLTRRLEAYDRAYVARIEQERGPITPDEYARLALAHDRDRAALTRALREIGLPWGATPRIQRVFAERMESDRALAERIRAAMAGG